MAQHTFGEDREAAVPVQGIKGHRVITLLRHYCVAVLPALQLVYRHPLQYATRISLPCQFISIPQTSDRVVGRDKFILRWALPAHKV